MGGLNSKLHVVSDGHGRPLIMLFSEGQMSDHKGAALMLSALPPARVLIGGKGYDSNRFRQALTARGIEPCIPSRRGRKQRITHDRKLYRQRHHIENMFGRLKDWRRIAMRHDRRAHTFMSAICLAATTLFWINES
ncbi:transposase, IS4 family [Pseudoroseomonas cervicalis ATCC 49957]|uniref:Transposase, IS4 family n=2 Tax=Teichococcus cervicalis TaxID=204525 RepID=D5RPS7_9PROT|nr:transposase, IS4 family [Pseudoroseomonas cervicalis ATCC 49957]